MTIGTGASLEAINDARALLDALLANDWREIHTRSGDVEIFIARDGGAPNPMRDVAPPARAAPVAREPDQAVTAPHIATLAEVLPAGTKVTRGQTLATLRVLDDSHPVEAPVGGTITRLDAAIGDLLDYKAPILSIAQGA